MMAWFINDSDSNIWWMRYRDKTGRRRLESTEHNRLGRSAAAASRAPQSRDNNTLDIVRKGKQTHL